MLDLGCTNIPARNPNPTGLSDPIPHIRHTPQATGRRNVFKGQKQKRHLRLIPSGQTQWADDQLFAQTHQT